MKFIMLIVAVIILGGLFFILKTSAPIEQGDNSPAQTVSSTPTPIPTRTFEFIIENRVVISAPESMQIKQGERVNLKITVDEEDVLHLHGYDKELELKPGQAGEVSFIADKSGRFALELHELDIEIGALEVLPNN